MSGKEIIYCPNNFYEMKMKFEKRAKLQVANVGDKPPVQTRQATMLHYIFIYLSS